MLHSIRNLFSYSWEFLVSALGTTTLSIVLFSFVIPIGIFVIGLASSWRTEHNKGATPRQIINKSLLSLQTSLAAGIYLLVWIGLLAWAVSKTTYMDHLALLRRIRELRTEIQKADQINAGQQAAHQATAAENLRLRDMERAAFQLGRLVYLLQMLEEGTRQHKVAQREFDDSRNKTLGYLRILAPKENLGALKVSQAKEVMDAASRIVRENYTGRVENAYSLAVLMQVFQLSGGEVSRFADELKAIARDRERIWTADAILLPEDPHVRSAAKLLYDYAAEGRVPPRNDLRQAENMLARYYEYW